MPNQAPRRPLLDGRTGGDYVMVKGQRADDATYASEVIFCLTHERGSSPVFPDMGARFHELTKITSAAARQGDVLRQVELMADEAVAHLTTSRKILEWLATATLERVDAVLLRVQWRERSRPGELLVRTLRVQIK